MTLTTREKILAAAVEKPIRNAPAATYISWSTRSYVIALQLGLLKLG